MRRQGQSAPFGRSEGLRQKVQPAQHETLEKMREMLEPWNPEHEFEDGLFRQSVSEFGRRPTTPY